MRRLLLVAALVATSRAAADAPLEFWIETVRDCSRGQTTDDYWGEFRTYPEMRAALTVALGTLIALDTPDLRDAELRAQWHEIIDAIIAFAATPPYEEGWTPRRNRELFALRDALERFGRQAARPTNPGWQRLEEFRDDVRAARLGSGSVLGLAEKIENHLGALGDAPSDRAVVAAFEDLRAQIGYYERSRAEIMMSVDTPKNLLKRLHGEIERRRDAILGPRRSCAAALS